MEPRSGGLRVRRPRFVSGAAVSAIVVASMVLLIAAQVGWTAEPAGPPQAALGVGIARSAEGEGVQVLAVAPGSPADKAGLRPGDRIVSLDGKKITEPKELIEIIRKEKPGAKVEIGYSREGKENTVAAVLSKRRPFFGRFPEEFGRPWMSRRAEGQEENEEKEQEEQEAETHHQRPWLGVVLNETEEGPGALVEIVEPGSPAAQAGLRPGDTLLAINAKKVASPEDAVEILEAMKPGSKVNLRVNREGKESTVKATLGSMPPFPGRGPAFGPPMMLYEHQRLAKEAEQRQRIEAALRQLRQEVQSLRKEVEELKSSQAKKPETPAPPAKKGKVRT
jgi:membrane-associated protease RseP (regulator of RpoE activity)